MVVGYKINKSRIAIVEVSTLLLSFQSWRKLDAKPKQKEKPKKQQNGNGLQTKPREIAWQRSRQMLRQKKTLGRRRKNG